MAPIATLTRNEDIDITLVIDRRWLLILTAAVIKFDKIPPSDLEDRTDLLAFLKAAVLDSKPPQVPN